MFLVLGILIYRSPGLAFFALATLPLLNVAATRFTKRMYPVGLQLQQSGYGLPRRLLPRRFGAHPALGQ